MGKTRAGAHLKTRFTCALACAYTRLHAHNFYIYPDHLDHPDQTRICAAFSGLGT
jgi:hypothetical protein